MNLQFGKYTIEWDGIRNWTLSERVKTKVTKKTKVDEDGNPLNEESERIIGYYNTLENVLVRLSREVISQSNARSVSALIQEIKATEKSIREMFMSLDVSSLPAERITR